ncbi:MAG: MFS transporter [Planctomycetota bacterium]
MLARLSVLMFLQYSVPGVVLPLYSMRLDALGFSPWQIALCSATHGVASILAPLMGQLADRWLAAQKCLAVCGVLAALDLAWLLVARDFWSMLLATQLFWLLAVPMMMLGTAITFTHLEHPEAQFGFARLWGTIGWMATPWILFGVEAATGGKGAAGDTLIMAGMAMSLVLTAYTFTLPDTPPRHTSVSWLAPAEAVRRLAGVSFFTFAACMAGFCLIQPFAIQGTPLLLNDLLEDEWGARGARVWLPPLLTIAQVSEITCLALLPAFLNRLGQRGSMLLGLATWCLILGMLSMGGKVWLVLLSLGLNGPVITGFLVVGQVYLNSRAHGDLKASAQSLMFSIQGTGLVCGHLLFGALRAETPPGGLDGELPGVFAIGAGLAFALLAILWAGFRPDLDALEDD